MIDVMKPDNGVRIFKLWSIVMIRDGRLVDTAHLRSQKCAVSEANAQFCPLILPLTIQQCTYIAKVTATTLPEVFM